MARRSKFGRFQVANEASDPFKHTDLAYNLDHLDTMIGGDHARYGIGDDFNSPSTSAPSGTEFWLAPQDPTVIANFGVRSLYNIVRGLDYNDVPLGAVFAWWRPTDTVDLPAGCVPCDGASYTGTDKHSYQANGLTTITVPDLRNAMILGANAAITDGTTATTPSIQSASGAPGIRGTGGINVPRNLVHSHGPGTYAVASHDHVLTDHQHYVNAHYHWMEHVHTTTITDHTHTYGTGTGDPSAVTTFTTGTAGGSITVAAKIHQHSFGPATTSTMNGAPLNANSGGTIPAGGRPMFTPGVSGGSVDSGLAGPGFSEGMTAGHQTGAAAPAVLGTSASAGSAVEIMPKYVGLLYVIKIRKAGPLHNTVFPPGT